jgi:hypothetical protein
MPYLGGGMSRPSTDRSVTVSEGGRGGSVTYREPGGELVLYWELGGGEVLATVQVVDRATWRSPASPYAARRGEVLRFVADELSRQQALRARAEIDDDTGVILFRQSEGRFPDLRSRQVASSTSERLRTLRTKLALAVLLLVLVGGGVTWCANRALSIDGGAGTPLGATVRTETHLATLIRTLQPYRVSLHRDGSKDRYRAALFLVPLDGSPTELVPLADGFEANALALAKILGSDGTTLWFDVNGIGGVDLATARRRPTDDRPAPGVPLQGARAGPLAPRVEAYLAAGFFTGPDTWLGLHSAAEVERDLQPGKWLRRVVSAGDTLQPQRRFQRGQLEPATDSTPHRIVSFAPLGDEEYRAAAFLRMDERSEPILLQEPDGAVMLYTSGPARDATLAVARVDTDGRVLWTVDTGIERFKLEQILPGATSTAFVGPRPPVPNEVSEPLLVIVEHTTGKVTTHSLWR